MRVLRLEENCGFTIAKHTGMSSASGDIIVSLDCDILLEGDFLSNAAEILQNNSVGLCAPREKDNAYGGLFIDYQNIFLKPHQPIESDHVTFIGGGAFAIRKSLWAKMNGYSGHNHNRASDHYLSRLLLSKGYRLRIDTNSTSKNARRLSRDAFCRREWKWCRNSWLKEINEDCSLPEYALPMLLNARWRCSEISGKHDPAWIYFELLRLIYIYLEFCNTLGSQGPIPQIAGSDLLRIVEVKLKNYPMLFRLLRADLLRCGALPLAETKAPAQNRHSPLAQKCDWERLKLLLEEFEENSVLEYLDKGGVPLILAEAAKHETDFSSYQAKTL